MKKLGATLAFIVLILALLGLGIVWAASKLPEWIKPRVQELVLEKTGRGIDWDRLTIDWQTRRVKVDGIKLASRNGLPLAEIARIEAVVSMTSLKARAPVIDSLKVDSVVLRIARDEKGQWNFADVLEHMAKLPETEPARLSISNLEVIRSRIEFNDRPYQRQHLALVERLAFPQINFGIGASGAVQSAPDPLVLPELIATLDGSPIRLKGQVDAFGPSKAGFVDLQVETLDMVQWQPYLPEALRIQFAAGKLNPELRFKFQGQPLAIEMSGIAKLRGALIYPKGVEGAARNTQSMASNLDIEVPIKLWNFKTNEVQLGAIKVQAEQFQLLRDATGQINWTRLWKTSDQPQLKEGKVQTQSSPAKDEGHLQLDSIDLKFKSFRWLDVGSKALPELPLLDFALQTGGYDSRTKAPIPFDWSFAQTKPSQWSLAAQGEYAPLTDQVQTSLSLKQFPLRLVSGFLPDSLESEGTLTTEAQISLKAGDPATSLKMQTSVFKLAMLELRQQKNVLAHVQQASFEPLEIDLGKTKVSLGSLDLLGAKSGFVKRSKGIELTGFQPSTSTQSEPVPSWVWSVKQVRCRDCQMSFADESTKPAVNWGRQVFNLRAGAFDHQLNKPIDVELQMNNVSAKKPTAATEISSEGLLPILTWQGRVTPTPLLATGEISLGNLAITQIEPYITEFLQLRLTRGKISGSGKLSFDATKANALLFTGAARVEQFQALEKASGNEFMRWERLELPQLSINTAGNMSLQSGVVDVTGLYARIILNERGQLNVRSILTSQSKPSTATNVTPTASPNIQLGGVRLRDGNVNFTDLFVKPSYNANLIQLDGDLGAIASNSQEPADLQIKGRVDNDAPLEIRGRLNPLSPTALLDVRAEARAVELTSLTPYAARWAGYEIEKGKLTAKLTYQIKDGRLEARNELLLNQLILGAKIESPDATKLPLRLAVALLKNSRGEIELDVPISGTLSDPEFAVGPIVWQAILNLLGRVITSPFTALASLAGGSATEMSYIDFPTGSSELNQEAQERINTLSKALKERPGLSLDIGGIADEQADRAGLQRVTLDLMLKGVKLRRMIEADSKVELPELEAISVTAEERVSLLSQLYKEYNLPNKPKNVLGIETSIGPDEQQRLLQESLTITNDLVRQLAQQRGTRTRERLMKEVPGERLFVIAPKVVSDAAGGSANRRVEFALR